MKPISIKFRCFGPYIAEQTVDFEELADYGLFLICGETGAGKTTILDAMCCALYGSCSGEIRGELENMRCRQADLSEPTEVEFIFECGGRRYRFRRTLVPRKSRKADAALTFNEEYSCAQWTGEGWSPLLDNAKKRSMNEKAAELVGLRPEQFRQVIILPQGKFETLLTSSSEDKEEILGSLFHTERWDRVVQTMADEVNARRSGIEREDQAVREGLNRLQAGSVEELPEKVKCAEQALEGAGAAEKSAEQALRKAREQVQLKDEFAELDRRAEELEKAKKNAAEDREKRTLLEMAEKAEKARLAYEGRQQAAEEAGKAEKRLAETEEKLKAAEERLKGTQAEKAAHEAGAGDQEKRTAERQRLAGLRERYGSIRVLRQAEEAAKQALEDAGRKAEAAGKALEGEEEKLRQAKTAWDRAGEDYRRVSAAYLAATAGHMAAELVKGQPCPVCGSTEHPCPAVLPEGAARAGDVDAADERETRARKAYEARVGARDRAETDRREAEQAHTDAKAAYAAAAGTLQQAREQLDPGIETPEALEKRIRELDVDIQAYEEGKTRLAAACDAAAGARSSLAGAREELRHHLESVRKELEDREAAWKQALEETGLQSEAQYRAMIRTPEDRQRMARELEQHAAALKTAGEMLAAQQAKTEGKARPDFAAADRAAEEADRLYKEAIRARSVAEKTLSDLGQEAARLTALDAGIRDRRKALEEDSAFVRALRGPTGISIQRYVLGVRLGQVIVEANRLLSGIYGGRYRLHRSNASYGSARKSGLELEVYDSMSDQHRSVCTLSGGEKFLVALSLAIGLCTVVQNEQKGVNLEAMFIDEGFGSLDRNTLGDALDVLQGVQRGHGLVGIISHVQLLEETIPTKLEILKTPRGSEIRRHI